MIGSAAKIAQSGDASRRPAAFVEARTVTEPRRFIGRDHVGIAAITRKRHIGLRSAGLRRDACVSLCRDLRRAKRVPPRDPRVEHDTSAARIYPHSEARSTSAAVSRMLARGAMMMMMLSPASSTGRLSRRRCPASGIRSDQAVRRCLRLKCGHKTGFRPNMSARGGQPSSPFAHQDGPLQRLFLKPFRLGNPAPKSVPPTRAHLWLDDEVALRQGPS